MPYLIHATLLRKWFVGHTFEGVAEYGRKHNAIILSSRAEANFLAQALGPNNEVIATEGTLADA